MTDRNRTTRRRALNPSAPVADDEHPFLTPNGYRLQRQQPMNVAPQKPLPVYPPRSPLPQRAMPALPVEPVAGDELDLQNVLASKKFPNPELLDRNPLTQHCRSDVVANPTASPLKAIGKLFIRTHSNVDQALAMGTAFVAGPSILVTSAHNVFEFSKRTWCLSLDFHPAYDHYSSDPPPTCRVTGCTIPKAYLENPATNSDIAICYLDRNIGDILGVTIRMQPISDNQIFERQRVSVVGYPCGSGFDFGKQMWYSSGSYLFGRRNFPGDDYSPVMASRFGSGCSGSPWLIRDENNDLVSIGVTSGHVKLRQRINEPNLMSLTSPFFSAKMFDRLSDESVFHEFEVSHG